MFFPILVFAALIIFTTLVIWSWNEMYTVYAQESNRPIVVDNTTRFDIERVYTGINGSTNMAFIGQNDILRSGKKYW